MENENRITSSVAAITLVAYNPYTLPEKSTTGKYKPRSDSIPIYPLQRDFYPPKFGLYAKNDEVSYMLLYIEGTKIRNKTNCTPSFKMQWEPCQTEDPDQTGPHKQQSNLCLCCGHG